MLKYFFKNVLFHEVVKTNTKKEKLQKSKKEKLLFLIPEIKGNIVLSVCKTKIPTEYRKNGIRCLRD